MPLGNADPLGALLQGVVGKPGTDVMRQDAGALLRFLTGLPLGQTDSAGLLRAVAEQAASGELLAATGPAGVPKKMGFLEFAEAMAAKAKQLPGAPALTDLSNAMLDRLEKEVLGTAGAGKALVLQQQLAEGGVAAKDAQMALMKLADETPGMPLPPAAAADKANLSAAMAQDAELAMLSQVTPETAKAYAEQWIKNLESPPQLPKNSESMWQAIVAEASTRIDPRDIPHNSAAVRRFREIMMGAQPQNDAERAWVRASEQGFTTPSVHGTSDIETGITPNFNPSTHFGTPRQAADRLRQTGRIHDPHAQTVPVLMRGRETFAEVSDMAANNAGHLAEELLRKGAVTMEDMAEFDPLLFDGLMQYGFTEWKDVPVWMKEDVVKTMTQQAASLHGLGQTYTAAFHKFLRDQKGIKGLAYVNDVEGTISKTPGHRNVSYVVFEPGEDVRSLFAKFDPAKSTGLQDLGAAITLLLGGAAAAGRQPQREPR